MLELENFLTNFVSMEEELCVIILNKKLYRIGSGDPASTTDKMAYYGLIGHAYQNHLLEKVTVSLDPGFKYTFIKNGKPQNMKVSDEL